MADEIRDQEITMMTKKLKLGATAGQDAKRSEMEKALGKLRKELLNRVTKLPLEYKTITQPTEVLAY